MRQTLPKHIVAARYQPDIRKHKGIKETEGCDQNVSSSYDEFGLLLQEYLRYPGLLAAVEYAHYQKNQCHRHLCCHPL